MVGEPGLYPMRLSKAFGIPRDIDAAFHDSYNDRAYFFKGEYENSLEKIAYPEKKIREIYVNVNLVIWLVYQWNVMESSRTQ